MVERLQPVSRLTVRSTAAGRAGGAQIHDEDRLKDVKDVMLLK